MAEQTHRWEQFMKFHFCLPNLLVFFYFFIFFSLKLVVYLELYILSFNINVPNQNTKLLFLLHLSTNHQSFYQKLIINLFVNQCKNLSTPCMLNYLEYNSFAVLIIFHIQKWDNESKNFSFLKKKIKESFIKKKRLFKDSRSAGLMWHYYLKTNLDLQ